MTRATSGLVLAIETSNAPPPGEPGPARGRFGVALGEADERAPDGMRLIDREALRGESRSDEGLIPAIERVTRRSGVGPEALAQIAVSVGPGGFTGLRVAVAAAQMIALARSIPVTAVPTADAVARAVPRDAPRPIALCLAWKRQDVWRRVWGEDDRLTKEDSGSLVGLRDVLTLGIPSGVRTLIAESAFVDVLRREGVVLPTSLRVVEPEFDPALVLVASVGRTPVSAGALTPIYPREPEAVTKWRLLHPRRAADA